MHRNISEVKSISEFCSYFEGGDGYFEINLEIYDHWSELILYRGTCDKMPMQFEAVKSMYIWCPDENGVITIDIAANDYPEIVDWMYDNIDNELIPDDIHSF